MAAHRALHLASVQTHFPDEQVHVLQSLDVLAPG